METSDLELRVRYLVKSSAPGLIAEDRVGSRKDLIDHGEAGIAFEHLCSNLDDLEWVPPTKAMLVEFENVESDLSPGSAGVYWQRLVVERVTPDMMRAAVEAAPAKFFNGEE